MYPALEEYVKSYYLPLPANWPGFYYPKKLIAQGKEKRIATIIPEQGFHIYLNAVEDIVLVEFLQRNLNPTSPHYVLQQLFLDGASYVQNTAKIWLMQVSRVCFSPLSS